MSDEKETAMQTAERLWTRNKAKSFSQWGSLLPDEQLAIIKMLSDAYAMGKRQAKCFLGEAEPEGTEEGMYPMGWTDKQIEAIANLTVDASVGYGATVSRLTVAKEAVRRTLVAVAKHAAQPRTDALTDPDVIRVSRKAAVKVFNEWRDHATQIPSSVVESVYRALGLPTEMTQEEKDVAFINQVRASGRHDYVEQMKMAMAYARGQDVK